MAEATGGYGEALLYYARAHNVLRVKAVLNSLMSICLLQSRAYPPPNTLDPVLEKMIALPNATISDLRRLDAAAAELLSTYLSGYAMLRRFYDLRDADLYLAPGQKPAYRPAARRRAAAEALLAAIASAADSIHGGLYDDSIVSVVPIEGLLVLLGETLPFVNQETRVLSNQQVFSLIRAVEDLCTVPPAVAARCEECLKFALMALKGVSLPSAQAILKQSTTGTSGSSSQYSLLDSFVGEGQANGSTDDSGVLVKASSNDVKDVGRAWDWRIGLEKSAKADDVLQILRLGLVREVSRAWTGPGL